MNQIRLLRPDEINCRVQKITDSAGAIILLYKDARVDMNILDETFGMMNWKRGHTDIDGSLFCHIDVWDDDKREWVSKEDVGVESFTEATKGEASDAFKRAGFNWGIGRELYTGPFIFVQLEVDEYQKGNNGKNQTTFKFGLSVKEITYNENREIKTLVLIDKQGRERFTFGKGKQKPIPEIKETPTAVKEPAKVTYACLPSEYDRRCAEAVKVVKNAGKTEEQYKAIKATIDTRSLKEMTAPEYDAFLFKLTDALK